ncbi:MAG: hypothetical protein SGJ27_04695 [Candidatus Melainabacteria bacterium]|nr:hypothetical protein [Candidatus Melainabacteria bacterium]
MSTTPGLTHRVVVLTSMFCLVSVGQKVHAEGDHADRHNFRNNDIREQLRAQRWNAAHILDKSERKIQIRQDREVLRNTAFRQQDFIPDASALARHERKQAANSALNNILHNPINQLPRHTGTISDTGGNARKIDLDLTSSTSKIILGSKLFNEIETVTIDVGGEKQSFRAGSQVTAGQFVAIKQVLDAGSQSLILDKSGAAAGGSFSINSVATPKVSDLVIAAGVTGIDDFATDRRIGVKGDFTNYGTVVGTSSNDKITGGIIFGNNINNESGGSIQSVGANEDLDLTLAARDRIRNVGSIVSSGSITLETGSGTLSNTGEISSARGNINVLSPDPTRLIDVQAQGGSFEALNGSINIRDGSYSGAADVRLQGGDYLSKSLNIYSGSGIIDGNVGKVTGELNSVAAIEHFYASTDLLIIGDNCITGDPTFANSTGGIQIQGQNTFGEAVAFLANGDITANGTAQVVANGFNVTIIAGAAITVSAGPETSTVPGSAIGAGTTATVDFSAGNGGSIDLSGSSVATVIDTSSSTGNGGKVVLGARANGTTGGLITLSTTSLIDSSSSFNNGNGGDVSAFAGADPASAMTTLQLGSISSNAGPGTGSGGNVSLNTAQPTGTGGSSVTFDSLGQIISGGPIIAATPAVNGQISVNNISATGSATNATVSIVAGKAITAGTINASGNVAISGSSVTPAAITSASDITILTTLLHNDGAITSTKSGGSILVQSPAGLTLEGSGSFALTGGGTGTISLDANGDNALALTSSHTFSPGSSGTVSFTSESENGSITIAPAITLTFNDGGKLNIGTPFLHFLGDASALNAPMASDIKINSGGGLFPLMIASPDNGVVTISTGGGTIDITPTTGYDLIFANLSGVNQSTLNLMGGPVTTNTVAAGTFVSSAMHLNSDNNLAMSTGGAGGIIGLAFQPYVGGFVNGNATTQFDGYSLDTVKALMQQLKNDGYTDVATYSQGSFYFGGQFYGPTAATAGSNKFNIQAAAAVGLGISAGVFQQGVNGDSFNVADTTQELAFILQQAQLYPGTVKEIIICNESIFGAGSLNDLNTLIAAAIALRNSTPVTPGSATMFSAETLPITTRQRWDVLAGVNNNANPLQGALKTLINSVEGHIYANMYAYFDGALPDSWSTAPADQTAFTTAVTNSMSGTLTALKTAFQGQGIATNIRIGETGWPTEGLRAPPLPTAPALGNVTLSNWYFQAMKTWSATNNVPTVIFQAYDQPWQTVPAAQVPTTPGSSEGYFGLYTANGVSTQTSFTLTSITNKFAPNNSFSIAAVGTSARMLSNAGTITASNVVVDTPLLANNGAISSTSAAGSVSVSSNTDFDLTGTGTISRSGGGTGSIAFTTIGANDLEVRGTHTLDAGAGNAVTFNAVDDGASFTLGQGATINLPTNNTALAINSEHFLRNGNINTNSGTNPNTTVTFNGSGDSTIASSVGPLDIAGMDINVATGHLALLSAGDIINTGGAISLDLNAGGFGGNLILIAGHSFDDITLGSDDPFYVLDAVSNTTGGVVFNAAGHEVNINTAGANGGGNVEVYANGSVALNELTTSGGSGLSGNVTIAGNGITTGQINTTATAPSNAGSVNIQSGTVVHDGVHVTCGVIETGSFDIADLGGNISTGAITADQSSVRIQTNGSASAINFTAGLPVAHDLALLAGTGTLNLPTSNIAVSQDSSGSGGSIALSASDFAGAGIPLVLNASGVGTGDGGSVVYTNTSSADLQIDENQLQILATGVNGGSVSVSGAGNVRFNSLDSISAGPTGPDGNGASFNLASTGGALVIIGELDASANGTGSAGDVTLDSNSSNVFKIGTSKTKNGIQGRLSMDGVNPGSLTVRNSGGGISILQTPTFDFENLTLDTGNAPKGSITLKNPVVANNTITLSIGGKGKLYSQLLSASTIALIGGSKTISAVIDAQTLTANSIDSVKITNINANALTIGTSNIGNAFSVSSLGTINTSGNIVATNSVELITETGDILLGGNITADGNILLEIRDSGNFQHLAPLGTDVLTAGTVQIIGTTSSIGSGNTIAGALRVEADKLELSTGGTSNVTNVGTDPVELAKASTADAFNLRSSGTVIVSSALASSPSIAIDTTAGVGDIIIQKSLGSSSTTQTINLSTADGSISANKALSAATTITLQSASGGDIGTAGNALLVSAPSVQATTNAAGTVTLAFSGSAPSVLLNSASGGNFSVSSTGNLTLNDIAVSEGSITVSNRETTAIAAGANVTVNSTGAAGSGSITIQGTHKATSAIFVGAGSTIATSGIGGGDVALFIGKNSPPTENPLPDGQTGNIFVTTSGGGQVFADLSTITANAPNNALNAIGKNVLINGGVNGAITLDGNVTITADPPVDVASLNAAASANINMTVSINKNASGSIAQTAQRLPLNSNPEQPGSSNLHSPDGISSSVVSLNNSPSSLKSLDVNSLNIGSLNINTLNLNASNSNSLNTNSNVNSLNSNSSILTSTNSALKLSQTNQAEVAGTLTSIPEHSQLVGSAEYITGEVDAVHLTQENAPSSNQQNPHQISSGSFLYTPADDMVVKTSLTTVKIDKGSMVLLMVHENSVAVFNLHDSHKNAVTLSAGKQSLSVSPGHQAVLTRSTSDDFHLINPAEIFQYRNLKHKVVANGLQMFTSEFSVPTALMAIKPAKQLLLSQDKNLKRLTNNVLKTTAIMAELNRSSTKFEEMPHPRLAVYQK